MKRLNTATLTFHASHNYGSMLQAYALQHFLIKEIGVDNEIINFRSIAQKKMYSFPKEEKHSWKYNLIKYLLPNTKEDRIKKYNLFESFLSDYLTLSPEYNEEKDISYPVPKAGANIAGVPLETGSFAYLEPRDAHRPSVKLTTETAKKLIFKIPVKE